MTLVSNRWFLRPLGTPTLRNHHIAMLAFNVADCCCCYVVVIIMLLLLLSFSDVVLLVLQMQLQLLIVMSPFL